jgi:RND family efflux transporter MFP subunit
MLSRLPCDGEPFVRVLGLAIVSSLISLTGCAEPERSVDLPDPLVTFVLAESRETIDYDEYTGWTSPSETVEVRSRVYGFLKSIEFQDGDNVQAGQLLYRIEPDEYEAVHRQSLARITVAESRLSTSQARLQRMESLRAANAISKEEYDESFAAVRESEAQVIAARADADRTALDLKYTQLLAPLSGQIDRSLVTPGNLVTGGLTGGTLLTRIVAKSPMHVFFDVDEAALLRYRRMQPNPEGPVPANPLRELDLTCEIQLADETEYPHRGKLDFVESVITQTSGTISLRASFANENQELPAGAFVRVRIPVSQPYTATLIPEAAIGTDQTVKYAYVLDEQNVARRRSLKLGRQIGSQRLILEGVSPGEKVVLSGLLRVRPDKPVTPRPANGSGMGNAIPTQLIPTQLIPTQLIPTDAISSHSASYSNQK